MSCDCNKTIQELSNYLDNEIDEELKHEIEVHLVGCIHCEVVFDTTRRTIELYCDGKLFPLPTGVSSRLHEALRRKCRPKAL